MLDRRRFLTLSGVAAIFAAGSSGRVLGREIPPKGSLISAPIELGGDWLSAPNDAVIRVLTRIRAVDLTGIRSLSDRQPKMFYIENRKEGPPAIWLHSDRPETASIIVNVGDADWCKLAYQFGHELGHVLSNSWQFSAKPHPPTQWLEEILVETFSLRGIRLLADSWEKSPPFTGDAGFARAIRKYGLDLVEKYKVADRADLNSAADWFRTYRAGLETGGGKSVPWGPAISGLLAIYESSQTAKSSSLDDLAALNRWPERTSVPVERYLGFWKQSCAALGSAGDLPTQVQGLFGIS